MPSRNHPNGAHEPDAAPTDNGDSSTPPPPGTPVESKVTFFLKVDPGDSPHNGNSTELYLGPDLALKTAPYTGKVASPIYSDDLAAEMQQAEDDDKRYIQKLRDLGGRWPINMVLRNNLRTGSGDAGGAQLTLTDRAEFFETYVVTEPGESRIMHYDVPFQMSLGSKHLENVYYPDGGNLAPVLATPSVRGVYDKFILFLLGEYRMHNWKEYMEGEKDHPDPYRNPSTYFRIEFVDWPENLKKPHPQPPKTGDRVCTGDRVRLAIVRENEAMEPTSKNRGFARPIFSSSMGDVDWRASNGTTFTFHYGPVTWRLEKRDSSTYHLVNEAEKEQNVPRR